MGIGILLARVFYVEILALEVPYGRKQLDRMDKCDMESVAWVHQGFTWMQELLYVSGQEEIWTEC